MLLFLHLFLNIPKYFRSEPWFDWFHFWMPIQIKVKDAEARLKHKATSWFLPMLGWRWLTSRFWSHKLHQWVIGLSGGWIIPACVNKWMNVFQQPDLIKRDNYGVGNTIVANEAVTTVFQGTHGQPSRHAWWLLRNYPRFSAHFLKVSTKKTKGSQNITKIFDHSWRCYSFISFKTN
jgi:hypothetical protein